MVQKEERGDGGEEDGVKVPADDFRSAKHESMEERGKRERVKERMRVATSLSLSLSSLHPHTHAHGVFPSL